jgi:hypothetical protein
MKSFALLLSAVLAMGAMSASAHAANNVGTVGVQQLQCTSPDASHGDPLEPPEHRRCMYAGSVEGNAAENFPCWSDPAMVWVKVPF